ncbi:MAG TPA: hypothetical protein VFW44_10555 [Bryobacteraceae bacterium]|nr:hypothetical protein [Bryobacteraceae bacterium]
MKTIALTLLFAAAVFAQSSSSAANTSATNTAKDKSKTSKTQKAPEQRAVAQKPQASKPPAKAEPPVTAVPTGAVQVEPNLYRYTDSNGKTWNYRQTPFGINKWEQSTTPEAQPAPAPAAESSSQSAFRSSATKSEPITVKDLGDSYQFDKNTPFGHSTWTRKKSEITAKEKAIVEGRDTQPDATGGGSKPAGN